MQAHLQRTVARPVPSSVRRIARRRAAPMAQPLTAGEEAHLKGAALWQRTLEVYDAAQASGAASKTDTRTELLTDPATGVEWVLRLATALRAKPKGEPPAAAASAPGEAPPAPARRNPFLPYEEALWVGHLSATHTLLLNKYNVVAHHLLVVTRGFRSQEEPLDATDLAATLRMLHAMPRGGVAFYNCGAHSGRSQPHKHLQVVPLPFDATQPPEAPIQAAVDAAVAHAAAAAATAAAAAPGERGGALAERGAEAVPLRQLPFRAYAAELPPGGVGEADAARLEATASQLLASCQRGLAAPVSYNVVLTRSFMLMAPRRRETSGPCAINSLGFAGTILVRSEEELGYVKARGPLAILADVGWGWESEQGSGGAALGG